MRLDLYTSEDRAYEARVYFMEHEAGRYKSWCIIGSYCTSSLLAFILIYFMPNFVFFSENIPIEELVLFSMIWPVLFANEYVNQPSRIYAILILSYFGMFILGYISAKLVAFFQGLVTGIISGIIVYAITLVLLYMLEVPQGLVSILPWITSVTIGFIVFILGLMGAFLPNFR